MINKESLTEEQLERFEQLDQEMGMNMFEWFEMDREPHMINIFNEIVELGRQMAAMIRLYNEELKKSNLLPLSQFDKGFQNINTVVDCIESEIINLLEDGATVQKQFVSGADEDSESEISLAEFIEKNKDRY